MSNGRLSHCVENLIKIKEMELFKAFSPLKSRTSFVKKNFKWAFVKTINVDDLMNQIFQNKEARRIQQSHDPNYLKDSPKSPARNFEDVPPVQAIDLGVPLHIPGLASADQVRQSS